MVFLSCSEHIGNVKLWFVALPDRPPRLKPCDLHLFENTTSRLSRSPLRHRTIAFDYELDTFSGDVFDMDQYHPEICAESRATPDLLKKASYGYTLNWFMDDQPVCIRTEHGPLLCIPYPQEANDIPTIVARKDAASAFADIIIDNFDEMLEQSQAQPLVMGIALHPYLVGQPYCLRHLRRALAHICQHRDDMWITQAGLIYDAFAKAYVRPE